MTIFRFSLLTLAVLLAFAGGYGLSEYNRLEVEKRVHMESMARAKVVIDEIEEECGTRKGALFSLDQARPEDLVGAVEAPILMASSYGSCPGPDDYDAIACAHRKALQNQFYISIPPMLGECDQLPLPPAP